MPAFTLFMCQFHGRGCYETSLPYMYRKVALIRPHAMSLPSWVFGRGRELDQGCQVQYDVQQRRGSDSMCWIVHIFILNWQVLCTAVHASVQHRISLYTPKSLHKEKIDRGREFGRGWINGTLRYMYTTRISMC